jgi:hypothetical protein
MKDAKMPAPFEGFYGSGQGVGAGYVNPTAPRLVHSGTRDVFPHEQVNARSGARAARGKGGRRDDNSDVGGR